MGPSGGGGGGFAPYAMGYRQGMLTVPNGGGPVPLTPLVQSVGLQFQEDSLVAHQSGMYLATYTMSFPVAARVSTVLSLYAGGGPISGSICHVDKENAGQPFTAVGQVLIRLAEGETLHLHSTRGFAIAGVSEEDTLASLTALRVGE